MAEEGCVDNALGICQNGHHGYQDVIRLRNAHEGMRNHVYLEKAKFLAPAQTKPEYELMYNGSIPAMKAGSESVKGELYEVDDETLKNLDVLEEVNAEL